MVHTVTVDELSWRLKRVHIARMFKRELEEDGMSVPIRLPRRLPKRNSVNGALQYVNRRFCIGIDPDISMLDEDTQACMLHDLANLPFELVLERMQKAGVMLEL